jgi:hypothetical protein
VQLHDVRIERSVDPALIRWPMKDILSGQDGESVNRLFCNLAGMPWPTVEKLIQYEEEGLARVESGAEEDEEESEDEEWDEWENPKHLFGLDLGVASAVAALSAANCFPVSSCNGEPDHNEPLPTILFRSRVARVPDLIEAAEAADCGLINNCDSLELYAAHVRNLVDFARALLKRHRSLRPLYRRGQGGRAFRLSQRRAAIKSQLPLL